MLESYHSLSQRESYPPNALTRFLWWLSTAEKELIADCVIDRNRYAIIGTTVLATWLFASFAWMYFFMTVVERIWLAVLLGLFLGFIILSIDRALIKGITKANKRKIAPILFRGILALTIGTFMAQPALLYIFDKEIKLQTSIDNEQKRMKKRAELTALYQSQKDKLQQEKKQLQSILDTKYTEVAKARDNFIAETDGTGGSGKIGLKNIALAKKDAYEKLDAAYQQTALQIQPRIYKIDSTLQSIESNISKAESNFETLLNNGFLTRIEALSNLIKTSIALQFRYYLIVVILVLIELMPVIAKTMLPSGTYDEKVYWKEHLEKEMVKNNMQHEQDLKLHYNALVRAEDEALLQTFFDNAKPKRNNQINQQLNDWNSHNNSFDNIWQQLKRNVFAKLEN